jgi:hypothetical protein
MEISENSAPEDRIALLEKKLRDMEALMKGLVAETLDLKSVAMTMTRQNGEPICREFLPGPGMQDTLSPETGGTARIPDGASASEDSSAMLAAPAGTPDDAAPGAGPEMVRIMQSDGTFKMEPRSGDRIR